MDDNHEVFEFNLSDGHDVRKATAAEVEEVCGGKLDVLINNAGVNDIDWLEHFTEERWDTVMDTNAKGVFMMTRAALPLLAATWLLPSWMLAASSTCCAMPRHWNKLAPLC